jgi:hypothetical protein
MKKYKGGFSERLQKRSGGRIKAAVGGPQELKNITNYTPMPKAKVKPPVKAKPLPKAPVKNPVEKISIGGVGGGKTIQPRMTNDLPKLIPGQPTASRSAVPTTSEEKLKQVDSSGNIIKDTLMGRKQGETAEQYRARTAGQFTPNPNQKTFKSR